MCTGLTLMVFVENMKILIWQAWPLIAIGGVCSHLDNIKMTLATPSMKGTFMAALSGSFGAGGSVGLIMKRIMDDYGVRLCNIFIYWLLAMSFWQA